MRSSHLSSFGARGALAKKALAAALKTRRRLRIELHEATCVFDAAERLGVEVRFVAIPSMEGMYVRSPEQGVSPHMFIAAGRPSGRQSMTGGHELGHHVFGHGTRVDQYLRKAERANVQKDGFTGAFDSEEFLAQTFGSYFLMPKSAVDRGFGVRGFDPANATPLQVYSVAGWLGVGYSALVHHMCWSLRLITFRRAESLLGARLPTLRAELIGRPISNDVYVVDSQWTGRPLDLKLGDVAIVPDGARVEASTGELASNPKLPPATVISTSAGRQVLEATAVGLGRIVAREWAVFVRVSRRDFGGLNAYRHLYADPDDHDEADDDSLLHRGGDTNAEIDE